MMSNAIKPDHLLTAFTNAIKKLRPFVRKSRIHIIKSWQPELRPGRRLRLIHEIGYDQPHEGDGQRKQNDVYEFLKTQNSLAFKRMGYDDSAKKNAVLCTYFKL